MQVRPWGASARRVGDSLQGVVVEMLTHVRSGDVPDREQDAVTLVVASAVLVGLSEVAQGDRTVDCGDDLGEADIAGMSRENVPAADAAL